MNFDEILRLLGAEVTADVEEAVRRAYVVASSHVERTAAEQSLDALLTSMLAAVILNPRGVVPIDERIETSCALLRNIIDQALKDEGSFAYRLFGIDRKPDPPQSVN